MYRGTLVLPPALGGMVGSPCGVVRSGKWLWQHSHEFGEYEAEQMDSGLSLGPPFTISKRAKGKEPPSPELAAEAAAVDLRRGIAFKRASSPQGQAVAVVCHPDWTSRSRTLAYATSTAFSFPNHFLSFIRGCDDKGVKGWIDG